MKTSILSMTSAIAIALLSALSASACATSPAEVSSAEVAGAPREVDAVRITPASMARLGRDERVRITPFAGDTSYVLDEALGLDDLKKIDVVLPDGSIIAVADAFRGQDAPHAPIFLGSRLGAESAAQTTTIHITPERLSAIPAGEREHIDLSQAGRTYVLEQMSMIDLDRIDVVLPDHRILTLAEWAKEQAGATGHDPTTGETLVLRSNPQGSRATSAMPATISP